MAFLCPLDAAVTRGAQRLPVARVPEQIIVTIMWFDVVDRSSCRCPALPCTHDADWMLGQPHAPALAPPDVIV